MGVHLAQALEAVDLHLGVGVVPPHFRGNLVPLLVGIGHLLGLAPGELIERGHGGVHIPLLNEGPHKPEEEGQQQGSDVGAVHVGIGHDDDFMIAQLVRVKLLPDACPQGGDHGAELVVAVDPVGPGLFHVQHLAPQRQDGLEAGIPALGGGAPCGVALHDVNFREGGVPLVAVPQLVGHLAGLQPGFPADGLSGLPGGFPGPGGGEGFFQNGPANGRILLEKLLQLFADDGVDQGADFRVAQLGLGLALELGFGELHGNDAGKTLPAVFAGDLFVVLQDLGLPAVGV